MSYKATTWAYNQRLPSSSLKFILVCFANYANEDGETYCSTSTLQKMTCMDPRTIAKWVDALEKLGVLQDTGQRKGKTKSIKIYKLVAFEAHPKMGELKNPQKCDEASPILQGSPPNFANPPTTPYRDKPKENINNQSAFALESPQGEERKKFNLPTWMYKYKNAWDGFVEMRTKKRHALTDRAKQMAIETLAELMNQGQDPEKVLDQSTFNSWDGLFELKREFKQSNGYQKPEIKKPTATTIRGGDIEKNTSNFS